MDAPGGKGLAEGTSTAISAEAAESIRAYFRDDQSRMTMMAARKFGVPERAVVETLAGQWPIIRLLAGSIRELLEALPDLGLMRVFVRSRAAVIESVGVFGGFSEAGPFFNVQTDTLDMHILLDEIADIYSVEKIGHDSSFVTHSFQFFDRSGDAAFKAFLWDNFPDVPPHRVAAFQDLTRRFAAEG
jgi:putative hemin transport protein